MIKPALPIDDTKRRASPHYRKQIKRLTVAVKALRDLDRIPNAPARPAKDGKKQEAHDAKWNVLPDRATIHFWCQPYTLDESRRAARANSVDSGKETRLTDSVRY